MARVRSLVLPLFALVGVVPAVVGAAALAVVTGTRSVPHVVSHQRALAAYGRLPLSFAQNRGQAPPDVAYVARGAGWALGLGRGGAELSLAHGRRSSSLLTVTTPGGKLGSPSAAQRLPGRASYFSGSDRSRWVIGAPTFARVVYRDVWPGVGLAFHGHQGTVEFDLDVAPGADADHVALRFAGARAVRSDGQGGAVISLAGGTVRLPAPRALQGARQISSRLVVSGDTIRLSLGSYDHGGALVVDPDLVYSTYLPGGGGDGIAVDSAGDAYISGTAFAPEVGENAFVAKLNPAGSALVYSTYLGTYSAGNGRVAATGIAVDSAGDAYLTGYAGTNFPTTSGAYQTDFVGNGRDAFVTELNASGTGLIYSTYVGSAMSSAIALDPRGDVSITGQTSSASFPTTPGAYQTTWSGSIPASGSEAFLARLNPAGSALLYSTYLGGTPSPYEFQTANAIAVDSAGDAYVTGATGSANFPTTPGAYQTTGAGGQCEYHVGCIGNVFVAKLNPAGSALLYSTYLGGSGANNAGNGIAVDSAGDAFITGYSGSSNFPTTPGAYEMNSGGSTNGFVTKLNPTGSALEYSTYLGGNGYDGNGVAIDSAGDAYVTGCAYHLYLPCFEQAVIGTGASDALVAKFNPTGSALLYSSYLSGAQNAYGEAIAVDSAGDAYITGYYQRSTTTSATSANFPTTPGAYQTNYGGGNEVFVSKLSLGGQVMWGLGISPRTFVVTGRRVDGRCVATTRANGRHRRCVRPIRLNISYQLTAPARLRFTITQQLRGRLVKRRCIAPAHKNRSHRSCTRLVGIRGALNVNGDTGFNSFMFNGRIGGRELAPGLYQLIATPSFGSPQTVMFRIAP